MSALGYGFMGGRTVPRDELVRWRAAPLAHEASVIARCQSSRTVHGRAAEAWSYEESEAWLRNAARVKRHGVTVPESREPSRAAPAPVGALPLPGAAPGGRQAASLPVHKGDLPDMTPEQWEEWEAAFGPEPNIPEDY